MISYHKYCQDLACPTRFERAAYASEELVAAGKFMYFNLLKLKNGNA